MVSKEHKGSQGRFVGEFFENSKDGKGDCVYEDGSRYFGDFRRGKKYGYGTFTSVPGDWIYEGNWTDNLKDGEGSIVHGNGSSYRGHFKLGKKYGAGILVSPNGDSYEGAFKDDLRHGKLS